ncbi:MAG: flap endonuclease-1 [Candidatus Marsarchaeota archaeon]|nr:flap endonuclease-1 [Candidatus Marsarchaeota archaeon]
MAVDLSKLITKEKISLKQLNGKTVAIDAYNVLYQFLSIIRQPDGSPLKDSKGRVTSHLSGLFYRSIDLIQNGITPIYVFDGIPSKLKMKTIEARTRRRDEAYNAWMEAKAKGAMEAARTYAQESTRVDKNIVASAKKLLELMGIAHISAPGEGEAQASYMCRKGLVYAAASQDYDTLLFGADTIIRNLTLSGRRKLPKKNVYVEVEPERIVLSETLANLGISRQQLIWVGIMLGNDFNEGIKGIGPKTALKIAKGSKSLEEVEAAIAEKYNSSFQTDVREVEELFNNPEVIDISPSELEKMVLSKPDTKGIMDMMCADYEFSENRIAKFAETLEKLRNSSRQEGISKWF